MKNQFAQSEQNLHYQVAQYIRTQHKGVIFRTDFAAGIRMTMGQALKHKGLQSGRAYPDVFIAEPRFPRLLIIDVDSLSDGEDQLELLKQAQASGVFKFQSTKETVPPKEFRGFCGLYIELKKPGTKLKRTKDAEKVLKGEMRLRRAGDWWDEHIEEQALMLDRLRLKGYAAEFAIGFDQARKLIDDYLKQ